MAFAARRDERLVRHELRFGTLRRESGERRLCVELRPVAEAQRHDRAASARDADRLVQLLDGSSDVGIRLEDRVTVEDELDVRIELEGLALDRRRLADRFRAPDHGQVQSLLTRERLGNLDRPIAAAVIDEHHAPRTQGLTCDRGQARGDRALFVERRDDHVDCRRPPVLARGGDGRVRAPQQPDQADHTIRAEHEIGKRRHFAAPLA